jgi:hypothetical protein
VGVQLESQPVESSHVASSFCFASSPITGCRGFTTVGVVLKMGYDALAERRAGKKEDLDRFASERREAYELFYEATKKQLVANKALYALIGAHRKEGKTDMSEAEKSAFPPSGMADLVTTLERIRRLARSYSIIRPAEAIFRLSLDMNRCLSAILADPKSNDEISWFLLQRFLEERIDEFVLGYREDLGIGQPAGAPKKWPVSQREFPSGLDLAQSEELVRAHIPIKLLPKQSDAPPTRQESKSPPSDGVDA